MTIRGRGPTPDDISNENTAHIANVLYHAHLPKLADSNIVSSNPEVKSVRLTEDPVGVETVVDAVSGESRIHPDGVRRWPAKCERNL